MLFGFVDICLQAHGDSITGPYVNLRKYSQPAKSQVTLAQQSHMASLTYKLAHARSPHLTHASTQFFSPPPYLFSHTRTCPNSRTL